MKKTVEVPDNLGEEERAIFLKVLKQFDLSPAKTKTLGPVPGIVRYIKVEISCTLCGSVIPEYIQMLKYSDESWRNGEPISEQEAKDLKLLGLHKDTTTKCSKCEDFLMAKDKEVLVQMILSVRLTTFKSSTIKNAIKQVKEGLKDG